jgi:hypothetical protein
MGVSSVRTAAQRPAAMTGGKRLHSNRSIRGDGLDTDTV